MKSKQFKFRLSFDISLDILNSKDVHFDLITKYCLSSEDINFLINGFFAHYDRNSISDPDEAISFLECLKLLRSIDFEDESLNYIDLAIFLILQHDFLVMSLYNVKLSIFKIH